MYSAVFIKAMQSVAVRFTGNTLHLWRPGINIVQIEFTRTTAKVVEGKILIEHSLEYKKEKLSNGALIPEHNIWWL